MNGVVSTEYVSLTDAASRQLALNTRHMLPERSEDYRIGPEDVLEVTIFEWELREETKTVEVRISESGAISLPVVGDLDTRGLTAAQTKRKIERRLFDGGFIMEPRVSVIVKEFRSKRVAVVGAVMDPGVYTLRQNVTTLLDVVSLAGGVSERAGYALYVIRTEAGGALMKKSGEPIMSDTADRPDVAEAKEAGDKEIMVIDLYELMEMGNLALNVVLRDGDVVNVPEAQRFSVIGYMREPGSFPLKKPTTVLEGIALAGGLKYREASPRACVLRRYSDDGEIIIPLDLVAISEGEAPNLYLMSNDVIEVRQTVGKKVFLDVMDGLKYMLNVGFVVNN